jgi:hypothetical protein
MKIKTRHVRGARRRTAWLAGGALAATPFIVHAARTWRRYGRPRAAAGPRDELLDRFLPAFEVAERHQTHVDAPAALAWEAARRLDLRRSAVVRGVFQARELLMGSSPPREASSRPLMAQALELGWGVLAEVPGRQVVFGAVTRPWEADVRFRALMPSEFAAWTVAVEPVDAGASSFRTETRVATTDAASRRRFRRYWTAFSPGIVLLRRVMLAMVRCDAERQARHAAAHPAPRAA